jgi:predicted dehydrogenase
MTIDRRQFVGSGVAAGIAAGATQLARAADSTSAAETVVVAVMGCNGRGSALARGFESLPNCRVAYICDVDERAVAKGLKVVADAGGEAKGEKDFRRALDDRAVDVLVCAAPNHWHGPATILGCDAGKHVYVEKPCCHNPREGELMLDIARKKDRVVTMGTQRRSSPLYVEAIAKIRAGALGKVLFARSWYNNRRGSIGRGKAVPAPAWLDYQLWQGPAPDVPFRDNLVHYHWHWRWRWGGGELGNNGVHSIDICRWALEVDYPTRVTALGGRYRFQDDQETPDTLNAVFEFGDKSIAWQGLSWSPLGADGAGFGITIHGDAGSMLLLDNGYKIFDMKDKEVASGAGGVSDGAHQTDFLSAIRDHRRPAADIEEAHKSTLLCHLGNISYRTGRTLHTDPENGRIRDDNAGQKLWSREYRPGFELE